MPAAKAAPKRVLGEASSAKQNIFATPSSAKKLKTNHFSSSPAPRFASSQAAKVASSQVKSQFESDVLEKLSQGISELKQSNAEKDQAWERPLLRADFHPSNTSLCFQQIEAEEGTLHGGSPTVKLFGVTEEGNSVMLHVKGFKHYIYVAAPVGFAAQDVIPFKAYLETQVGQHETVIDNVSMLMRENIYGFQNNTQNPFLKITVTNPKFINRVRTTIQSCNANWKGLWKSPDGQILTFDNIQYVLRFMVDCKVSALVYLLLVVAFLTKADLRNVLGRGARQQIPTHPRPRTSIQLPNRSRMQIPRPYSPRARRGVVQDGPPKGHVV